MQVVLVAARRKMIETLLEAVKAAGLKAEGVDLDAFALVRALAVEGDEPEQAARVFCHLGGVTNLAVAVGTNCFFTRPLSAVWDEDDAGSRLADEIRLSIDYYMTQPQAQAGRRGRALGTRLGRRRAGREPRAPTSGIPVTRAGAARHARRLGARRRNEDPHRYTVAAGLSLGAAA